MAKRLLIAAPRIGLSLICCIGWGVAAAADAEPPELRLDGKTRPTRYAVELTLVPEAETFSGKVTVDLELSEATSLLWLHAADLEIRTASLSFGSNDHDARVLEESDEFKFVLPASHLGLRAAGQLG